MEARGWDAYIKENYPWLAQKGAKINEKIDYSIGDEAKAGPEYRKLAELLREENWIGYAEEIEKIASDEDRHLAILKGIKKGLGEVKKAEELYKVS